VIAMEHGAQIIGSYVASAVLIGGYVWWMLQRARRVAAQVADEDRSWT
jgi:hypothetical protein